jgi:hypothetical protein
MRTGIDMSITTLKGPSVMSQIGGNLGQSLAEQLPQEMGRQRLAYALKGMQGKNQTPLEQMQYLTSVGGATPEQVAQYLPLIQNANATQALKNRVGTRNAPKLETEQTISALPKTGEITPDEITQTKQKMLQPIRDEDIEKAALNLVQSGEEPDINKAMAKAEAKLNTNLKAQQTQVTDAETGISKRLGLELNGSGLGDYKDISGNIQQNLVDKAVTKMIGRGMTRELAEKEAADIGRELGLAATQLKNNSSLTSWSKNKIRTMKAQADVYEKYGYGEQFDEMAAGMLGITPQKVASILHPIENAEAKNIIKGMNKWIHLPQNKTKQYEKLAASIKPSDNLLSLADYARSNNLDPNDFFSIIRDLKQQNKIALTDQQIRQLQKPVQENLLGDILFTLF